MRILLSFSLLLLSCDPGGPAGPDPGGPGGTVHPTNKGGTRLKAKVLNGSDGSKNYVGMYDTQLQEDCVYQPAEDGKRRCLPILTSANGGSYYSDAGCSTPLFVTGGGSCPAKYGLMASPICPYSYRMFSVTATSPNTVYSKNGANCSPATVTGATFYNGTPMPASAFVEGTEAME